MQAAEIESSESSLVATRPNCHISHPSSRSPLKGTHFPLLSSPNRMMVPWTPVQCLSPECWAWASVLMWPNTTFPQDSCLLFPPKLSQCPAEIPGPSCCHICPSVQGTEPPVCLLLLRFASFSPASSWSSLRHHTRNWWGSSLHSWTSSAARSNFRGSSFIFPLHLIYHQHELWRARISLEHEQGGIIPGLCTGYRDWKEPSSPLIVQLMLWTFF